MTEPNRIGRRRFLGATPAGVAGAAAWSSTSGDASAEAEETGQTLAGSRLKDRKRNIEEMVYSARLLRETIQSCPHRPRYHLMAPEAGPTNDVNGLIYWKGRYHFCILGRMPISDRNDPNKDDWRGRVWFHASSHDMVHWIHHPPVLKADENDPASHYVGPQSGTNIINAPRPTLIYLYGSQKRAWMEKIATPASNKRRFPLTAANRSACGFSSTGPCWKSSPTTGNA